MNADWGTHYKAMEQQTVSVAKASPQMLHATIGGRSGVIIYMGQVPGSDGYPPSPGEGYPCGLVSSLNGRFQYVILATELLQRDSPLE